MLTVYIQSTYCYIPYITACFCCVHAFLILCSDFLFSRETRGQERMVQKHHREKRESSMHQACNIVSDSQQGIVKVKLYTFSFFLFFTTYIFYVCTSLCALCILCNMCGSGSICLVLMGSTFLSFILFSYIA